jgi:hypothetical protein
MEKEILIEILKELVIKKNGVTVILTSDVPFEEEVKCVEFYFGKLNLYATYKLSEITIIDIISELDKFLINNYDYKVKRVLFLREYLISEVLKIN